jgi:hypothetical protein
MIPPEVLGHSNVAARDQSREFFNNIDPKLTFPAPLFRGHPGAAQAFEQFTIAS